tara:strand:- start:32 stop:244 length:213 start_codon:yes stop_codon:yes gene_type:complete
MTKQDILDMLEQIADSMDLDFLNRYEIEGVVKDIKKLQWKINTEVDCTYTSDIDEEVSAEIQIMKDRNGK